MQQGKLVEGVDYYINKEGLLVFTAHFLLKRGYCCGNGCLHCPYKEKKDHEGDAKASLHGGVIDER